jgi:hypothetical protein
MDVHPIPEKLGRPDLRVAGFQVWVHGREAADAAGSEGANWLRGTAHCGALGASVWAAGAILETIDVALWAQQCDALADGRTDHADLAPVEPDLQVQIRRIERLGRWVMRVQITPDHVQQKHLFDFEVDEADLRGIARQCAAVADAYPVRL